jgi:CheY-like chemotaxis protein
MTTSIPRRPQRKALVLAVERDPHVRDLERFFLEEAGFEVEFAEDGADGLQKARSLLPDIVLTEIILPQVDGLSVCRALKSDPATSHIAVLVFSILAAADRAREAGADAYLRKPLNEQLLVDSVLELLAPTAREVTSDGSD